MAKKKNTKKSTPRHVYRNAVAAPARRPPRAVVVRPRGPIASDLADEEAEAEKEKKRETPGWGALKAVGGALATTVGGAYLARQNFLPPKAMSVVLTGLGALLALEGPDNWKSIGVGAMSAAGSQLGFMLIDDDLIKAPDDTEKKEEKAPSKPAAPPGKRQAGNVPADALARAYDRARLRMALTSDGPD
jgi:hypothetical protein